MVEKILFDSGKAEIKPQGKDVLGKVGQVLLGVKDKQIRIEGYTDSVPIGVALRQQFPTNWELSAVRATTVLRFLEEKAGVDGKTLAAVGYGPSRPVASNDTTEGKAENRRVEITLTPLDVQEVLKGLKSRTATEAWTSSARAKRATLWAPTRRPARTTWRPWCRSKALPAGAGRGGAPPPAPRLDARGNG